MDSLRAQLLDSATVVGCHPGTGATTINGPHTEIPELGAYPLIDLCEDRGWLLHPAEVVVGLAVLCAKLDLGHLGLGELSGKVVSASPGD